MKTDVISADRRRERRRRPSTENKKIESPPTDPAFSPANPPNLQLGLQSQLQPQPQPQPQFLPQIQPTQVLVSHSSGSLLVLYISRALLTRISYHM